MDQFGKQRLKDFYIDPNYVNVNSGSYGYSPKVVFDYQRELLLRAEFNNDLWFRRDLEQFLKKSRAFVGNRINCPASNLVYLINGTDGINSLAKSIIWKEGDVVLVPNTTYVSTQKTFARIKDEYKIVIKTVDFTIPDYQSHETFKAKLEEYFKNNPDHNVKLAVFDHISAMPAFVSPLKWMINFFREKKIPLFIDGAHAYNQVPIDIGDLKPDAYFSNFHKWGLTPRTGSFLYVSDQYVNKVKPSITANFYGEGIDREFFWMGTRDVSAPLCVEKACEYIDSFGPGVLMKYNHELVQAAAKRVAEIWGTRVLTSDQTCIGSLSNVQIPSTDVDLVKKISFEMLEVDNCFPIVFEFDKKMFTRLSAQIFNQISDYEFMANCFLAYLKGQKKLRTEEQKEKAKK